MEVKRSRMESYIKTTPKVLQTILNVSLILLSVLLVVLLVKEIYLIGDAVFFSELGGDNKYVLTGVLTFFLYFEFLAMIVKYFKENYHFPLRYFIYIGITATIRYIVVDHDSEVKTLYISASILLLVLSYAVITLLAIIKKRTGVEN